MKIWQPLFICSTPIYNRKVFLHTIQHIEAAGRKKGLAIYQFWEIGCLMQKKYVLLILQNSYELGPPKSIFSLCYESIKSPSSFTFPPLSTFFLRCICSFSCEEISSFFAFCSGERVHSVMLDRELSIKVEVCCWPKCEMADLGTENSKETFFHGKMWRYFLKKSQIHMRKTELYSRNAWVLLQRKPILLNPCLSFVHNGKTCVNKSS